MGFIRSIFFFAAWGGWWGLYLGALCGTLIVPLLGTIMAAQSGLVMGVMAGLAWGTFLGLVIGPLHQAPPLARTQARRTWAIIALLVGGLGTSVGVVITYTGALGIEPSLLEPEVAAWLMWQLVLGPGLWGALALADATTRHLDRKTGHPDPLRPFGGPLSSSYFFFMEGGAQWRILGSIGLSMLANLLFSSGGYFSWINLLTNSLLLAFLPYSLWALLNGTFLGLLNRLVFIEYFQDMPRYLYRQIIMGITLALTLGSLWSMTRFSPLGLVGWLIALVVSAATLTTAYAYADAYYNDTDEADAKKGKHQLIKT
jgi:hypothetical protein